MNLKPLDPEIIRPECDILCFFRRNLPIGGRGCINGKSKQGFLCAPNMTGHQMPRTSDRQYIDGPLPSFSFVKVEMGLVEMPNILVTPLRVCTT